MSIARGRRTRSPMTHVEAVIVKTLTEKPRQCHALVDQGSGRVFGDVASRRSAGSGRRSVSNRGRSIRSSCPSDPLFVDKVRDIVGVVHESARSGRGGLRRRENGRASAGPNPAGAPLLPGTPERMSHDYVRHGTIDLYAALNLATGCRHPPAHPPPPGRRVPEVPQHHRPHCPRRS